MQNPAITHTEEFGHDLNIRIEEVGWALFLMMIGIIWFVPEGAIPPDSWLVGSGLIMLGINAVRYLYGVKMSGFTVFLGILALVAGLSGFLGLKLPVFAVLFVVLGASLLIRALFKK